MKSRIQKYFYLLYTMYTATILRRQRADELNPTNTMLSQHWATTHRHPCAPRRPPPQEQARDRVCCWAHAAALCAPLSQRVTTIVGSGVYAPHRRGHRHAPAPASQMRAHIGLEVVPRRLGVLTPTPQRRRQRAQASAAGPGSRGEARPEARVGTEEARRGASSPERMGLLCRRSRLRRWRRRRRSCPVRIFLARRVRTFLSSSEDGHALPTDSRCLWSFWRSASGMPGSTRVRHTRARQTTASAGYPSGRGRGRVFVVMLVAARLRRPSPRGARAGGADCEPCRIAAAGASGMLLNSELEESIDAKRRRDRECMPCARFSLSESGAGKGC